MRSACRRTKFFRKASPICRHHPSAVGRPPNHVRRHYASFSYRAKSWDKGRRVVAKVEGYPGDLLPRVGLDPLGGSSFTP